MSRPSASVLSTSTVRPEREVRTSPGFKAWPSGRFSTAGTIAEDVDLRVSSAADALHRADDTLAAAAHVALHLVTSLAAGLDGDAAGVERDALSDQRDRRVVLVPAPVRELDELRRLPAPARDGEQRAHAELAHPLLFENLGADRLVLVGEGERVLREVLRRADVAGPVAEVAGEPLARVDGGGLGDRAPGGGAIAGGADRHPAHARAGRPFRFGPALVEPVDGIPVGFRDAADPPGLVPAAHLRLAEEVGHASRTRAGHRPGGRPGGPPEAAVVQSPVLPEPHEQDPPRGDPGRAVQQRRRAGRPGEVAVRDELPERTTGRFVDRFRRGGQAAPFVRAEHETVGTPRERVHASRGEVDHCRTPRFPYAVGSSPVLDPRSPAPDGSAVTSGAS